MRSGQDSELFNTASRVYLRLLKSRPDEDRVGSGEARVD